MAGVLQHLRSSTLDKRPNPASMVDGQVAINYASGSPGMFFKDSNGDLVKVGPVHVGSTAPNVSPASGGTAGNSKGEQWLDTSGGTYVFKIWDGSTWRSEAGEFVNTTGDTMTGSLTMGASADIIFEGSVDDGFETTLTVVNPTADRTITLPNVTGTVVTTGDSGSVTSTMIANGTIVDADVNASAAIAGTKISPNFGSQTVQTTGIISAASGSASAPSIAFTGDTNTGIYSPGADQVAVATNGTGRLFVSSAGRLGLGTAASISASAPLDDFHIASTDPAVLLEETDAGTDEKYWRIRAEGSILRFEGVNDTFSNSNTWLNVTRTTGARTVDNIAFSTGGTNERLRIDNSGRLLVGTSSSITTVSNGFNSSSYFCLAGSATAGTNIAANYFANNATGAASLSLSKSRNDTVGSHTILNSGDRIGSISYSGSDGTAFIEAARIGAEVDGTPGANDMPGRLVFSTTADGASSPTERLRITSAGLVGVGTSSPDATLNVRAGANNTNAEEIASFSRPDATVRAAISKGLISGTTNGIALGTTTNHPFALNTNGTERLYITNAGLVGVGTSGPTTNLEVVGGATTDTEVNYVLLRGPGSSQPGIYIGGNSTTASTGATARYGYIRSESLGGTARALYLQTGTDTRVAIDNTGNVGIGTTSPAQILHLNKDASECAIAITSSNAGAAVIQLGDQADTNAGQITYLNSEDALLFRTGGSGEDVRIDSSGRLLVGTSTSYDSTSALQLKGATGSYVSQTYVVNNSSNLVAGNGLAYLIFRDALNSGQGAWIGAIADGTWATSPASYPTRLVFSTTADGASSPTERHRICEDGTQGYNQAAPVAVNTTATLTVANLKNGIITSTTAAAVTGTLPTGTLTEGGFSGLYTNFTFEWSVINTGATNNFTVAAGTNHTVVGNMVVAAGTSGRFASRRTAANTFVTYRLS